MEKAKSVHLTLNQKHQILAEIAADVDRKTICDKYGITNGTVSKIIKKRTVIEERFLNESGNSKHARGSDYPELDKALLKWFKIQRAQNLPINGPILLQKANELASTMNIKLKNETVSDGWVSKFKKRYNIRFRGLNGETGAADQSTSNVDTAPPPPSGILFHDYISADVDLDDFDNPPAESRDKFMSSLQEPDPTTFESEEDELEDATSSEMASDTEDPLIHLRNMKRRLTQTEKPEDEISAAQKLNILENTLNAFRVEVDMKLKIMQQILTNRNEQMNVQKKLLEREQSLYNSLLVQWRNPSTLSKTATATGPSKNYRTNDSENGMSESEPEYSEGDPIGPGLGPAAKKSRSMLRRLRKSGKPNQKRNVPNFDSHIPPPVEIQMKSEDADEDDCMNEFDELDEGEENSGRNSGRKGMNYNSAAKQGEKVVLEFVKSSRGSQLLLHQGFLFRKEKVRGDNTYWICIKGGYENCRARCSTYNNDRIIMTGVHNHFSDPVDIEKRQRRAELKEKAWRLQLQNISDSANQSEFGFGNSSVPGPGVQDSPRVTEPFVNQDLMLGAQDEQAQN